MDLCPLAVFIPSVWRVWTTFQLRGRQRPAPSGEASSRSTVATHLRMIDNMSLRDFQSGHRAGQGDKWSPQLLNSRETSPLSIMLRESGQVPLGLGLGEERY